MSDYLPLITVFVSGLFGLAVAAATVYLTNAGDNRKYRRDLTQKRYDAAESLYVDVLAILEAAIRETQQLQDCQEMTAAFPRLNARLRLSSTLDIVTQYELAGDLLYHWSSEFKRGPTKRIGDVGVIEFSANTAAHAEKAKEVFPTLSAEIVKLAEMMTAHLKSIGAGFTS